MFASNPHCKTTKLLVLVTMRRRPSSGLQGGEVNSCLQGGGGGGHEARSRDLRRHRRYSRSLNGVLRRKSSTLTAPHALLARASTPTHNIKTSGTRHAVCQDYCTNPTPSWPRCFVFYLFVSAQSVRPLASTRSHDIGPLTSESYTAW